MKRSIRFSQNFLHSSALLKRLLAQTNITKKDTVYDIGAGKGIIASALASICHMVIAIEADSKLVGMLRKNLKGYSNVLVYEGDFLNLPLPETPYKVFANIPFNVSADILHKLLDGNNPPSSSYLVVQKEFAQKLITSSKKYNSQLAVLLGVQYKIRTVEEISPRNFYPIPKVTSVFLEVLRRQSPLLPIEDLQLFRNFVIYAYNAFKPTAYDSLSYIFTKNEFTQAAKRLGFLVSSTPAQLNLQHWLVLFELALEKRQKLERLVHNYEELLNYKHSGRTKLNRTSR